MLVERLKVRLRTAVYWGALTQCYRNPTPTSTAPLSRPYGP
jgi:hypothetical protein